MPKNDRDALASSSGCKRPLTEIYSCTEEIEVSSDKRPRSWDKDEEPVAKIAKREWVISCDMDGCVLNYVDFFKQMSATEPNTLGRLLFMNQMIGNYEQLPSLSPYLDDEDHRDELETAIEDAGSEGEIPRDFCETFELNELAKALVALDAKLLLSHKGDSKELVNWMERMNEKLFEFICQEVSKESYYKVTLMLGTSRQSAQVDVFNMCKLTASGECYYSTSAFLALERLAEHLNEKFSREGLAPIFEIDWTSLTDISFPSSVPHAIESLKVLKEGLAKAPNNEALYNHYLTCGPKNLIECDEAKQILVHEQLKLKKGISRWTLLDDRGFYFDQDLPKELCILENLYDYFSTQLHLLPSGVKVEFKEWWLKRTHEVSLTNTMPNDIATAFYHSAAPSDLYSLSPLSP